MLKKTFNVLLKNTRGFNFLVVLLLFSSTSLNAQSTGNWTMFFGQLRIHDKWSIHAEMQYRDYGIFDEAEQLLLRTGINYHASPVLSATGGYARITNYANDEELLQSPSVSENRIWQQLVMKQNSGRFFFEHRYRLEQRWLHTDAGDKYLNRVRYLLRVNIPLNNTKIEKNTLFLGFYDEIFIHLTSAPFDRNRLYGSVGYQFTPQMNLQAGYLAQTVSLTTKHYLQLAVFYTPDLRKEK